MFTKDEAQHQFMIQTAFGAAPGTINGILFPGTVDFNVTRLRNTLDNPQQFGDGFEREFALGNKITKASGNGVPNLNFLGYLLAAYCDGLTSAAFTGVEKVTVTAGGSGYTSAPSVAFTGGLGTGAAAVAIVVAGQVVAVVMTAHGTGYTSNPTVSFTGGGGTGATADAAIDLAKFIHTGKPKAGEPRYHLFEKGVVGQSLFRRYLDLALSRLGFTLPVEGICQIGTTWSGSGTRSKNSTSLDTTPTEVTGSHCEYANLTLLEGSTLAALGIIADLSFDCESSVREKRPHNSGGGVATQMRRDGTTVRGTARVYFEDETLADKAENQTLSKLQAALSSPNGVLTVLIPEAKFETWDWERTDEGVMGTAAFRGIKKTDTDAPIKFTLVNTTSAYAS